MARLRFTITLLTLWLIFLFNIERYDIGGGANIINLPTSVYIASAFAVVLILAVPDFVATRWYFLLAIILVGYGILRYDDVITNTLVPAPIAMLSEWTIISIAFTLGRWLSATVSSIEQTYDSLVENDGSLRILSGIMGEEVINRELFRARRYDRPVSILYIKTPSLKQLERIYNTYLPYQVSLQQRYVKSRIAQLTETLLYATDPISWYGDDIVICLPETEKVLAYETAQRIAKVLHFSLNLDVPIGAAAFPFEGLIFADLVERAFDDLQYFTSEQAVGDDTSPIPTISFDDDDTDDNVDGGTPSYEAATFTQTEPYRPEESPRSLHSRLRDGVQHRLRQWYHSVEYQVDLIPPQEIVVEGDVDGKIFYNPDFWVNRVPHQSALGRRIYKYVKRALDIVLIVLASPFIILLFSVVGFLIWIQDRGPIFYSQLRTGEGAHKFRMYKFRSMVPNADEVKKEYGITTNDRGETVDKDGNKLDKDPRVTRIGRIIRKTSIDELPQLWNVLRGEMSLVGPRPTTFDEGKYTSFQKERLSVKPGLTGLWQVYDRGDTDFDNRLIWDIKYIDKMSLWMDIQIIFRTVLMQVLKRRGA
ncbi:MAG: sugar transferase [Anaerolineae bacterium]|nr:sugar transferase [Anaerolineae bacterium]MDQ7036649.1 sugar transferase [Anaerolineae bacterium]